MYPLHLTKLAVVAAFLISSSTAQQAITPARRSPLGAKPATTIVSEEHDGRTLIVKFAPGSGVRLDGGRFRGAAARLDAIEAYLDAVGARRDRLFTQSDEWLEAWRLTGEARSGRLLHDLTSFYKIELDSPPAVAAACDALNAFESVELAYPVGKVSDPVLAPVRVVPPAGTPDFESLQDYREAAPTGIDAEYGNTFAGGSGKHTTIVDVETGWTDDHEDLMHKALGQFVGLMPAPYPWDHGTAVLGELIGEDNGNGVRGLCYGADVLLSSHLGSSANIPTAVANAAAAAGPGDVVLLEVQCFGTPPGPFPCEYDAATFATLETATANGIHVFAAAGNGGHDLDGAAYGGLFDRDVRDSGAVMCGASNGVSLDAASFSNYGSRLDAHGWGQNVTTAGYGDLFGGVGVTREYTATFSGTSSATPIVTGAGVILNGIHRRVFGYGLEPLSLRSLLTRTGTPQGSGGRIGPRPDVRAAIEDLNLPRVRSRVRVKAHGTIVIGLVGDPGDDMVLLFSPRLRSEPLFLPFGRLFLGSPLNRVRAARVPASGELEFELGVPAEAAVFSTALGYAQAWRMAADGDGPGHLTNYIALEL